MVASIFQLDRTLLLVATAICFDFWNGVLLVVRLLAANQTPYILTLASRVTFAGVNCPFRSRIAAFLFFYKHSATFTRLPGVLMTRGPRQSRSHIGQIAQIAEEARAIIFLGRKVCSIDSINRCCLRFTLSSIEKYRLTVLIEYT